MFDLVLIIFFQENENKNENATGTDKEKIVEVPHEFLCPITHLIMVDPVSAEDGQTYEREAIEKWFKTVS